ncbi:hypothetical protein EHV10_08935 [Lachnoanaerobaculum gingivalis]|uniref:Type II secretion system protein GspF domain-containing protein n=1 Tax=Lachnoanaerobaculum gingivalis TaxID=2490855 RepID=A0A3P3QXI4_9FIRM|nr:MULTISPECIES: hypothetical protein [Lachnoanaerobaculum]EJZ69627.1 hypothetical protein HMPREF1135_01924 [Lachnoanaerobaculum sp. OBRC5-5]RRJ25033.1 hypothetical protein EHV10_08935 [Lachnoanaerobaculum gingivalis]
MKKYLRIIFLKNLKCWLIIIASFVIFGICNSFLKVNTVEDNYINRPGVDEYDTEIEIEVEGLLDKPQRIEIPITKRTYSKDEAKEAIKKGLEEILLTLPGENSSLQNITTDLNLTNEISDLGLSVKWDFGESELIDILGNVHNENLKENINLDIEVDLSYETYEESYIIPITVCPKILSNDERLLKGLIDKIAIVDKESIQKDGYTLPDTYDGKSLIYHYGEAFNFNIIPIMGTVIAILLYLQEKEKERRSTEKRKRELMKDYPDIVSKLIVFIGAGLSVRQSWESIVIDYENECKENNERRYAYEEMVKALAKLKTGIYENTVYKDFGRSCALRQYMKLASLLEQNRRNGLANLHSLLSMESQSAWDERINLARREGEELNTKLLLPLFMMLLIVMMIIIVPALLIFY